jgi:tRNA 2-selenouridine synthase
MIYVNSKEFLKQNAPIVDVRSPLEFESGHIPGAINIPVLDNDARKVVGTAYKKEGRQKAVQLGLEMVGPKMAELAEIAKQSAKNNKLNVYCWRGGMRSEKMAWLFETAGLQCNVLEGGYKNYRENLFESFATHKKWLVLSGATGSGKTEMLEELEILGEQIINLEKLANHKGSAFGALGMQKQPSSEMFQNMIFAAFDKLDRSKKIWIESESLTIGKVYLPETLWQSMLHAPGIEIEVDIEERIKHLVKNYGTFSNEELTASIVKIEKRLGGNNVKDALDFLEKKDLANVARLLLYYYDKSYRFGKEKNNKISHIKVQSNTINYQQNAKLILKIINELEPN